VAGRQTDILATTEHFTLLVGIDEGSKNNIIPKMHKSPVPNQDLKYAFDSLPGIAAVAAKASAGAAAATAEAAAEAG
jgi:hypothetical protein